MANDNPQKELGQAGTTQDQKKTTPDEGKSFDKDTVFVCVQECFQQGIRYHKGQKITGRKCPAYFVVDSEAPKEGEKR